jgi:hypothetical protein
MKITIENQDYEIDTKRAKELGLCKEVRKQITSFNIGDVFDAPGCRRIVIIAVNWTCTGEKVYNIVGASGLNLFSNFGSKLDKLSTYNKMLDYLNNYKYVLIGNINDAVRKVINNLSSPF